jgi:hypothetical protein
MKYTGTNNAAHTERMAAEEMRQRWGIKVYRQLQRCSACGTLNRLLNPKSRRCYGCRVLRVKKALEV